MKILFILFIVMLFIAKRAYAQDKPVFAFTILVDCKAELDKFENLYLAGNFNGWNPAGTLLVFDENLKGYTATINSGLPVAFKITKGTWASVACNTDGTDVPNYVINQEIDLPTFNVKVEAWKDKTAPAATVHTAATNVFHFPALFPVPYSKERRGIWVYVPPNYFGSVRRYPVIYMHDGQNLFDEATSFAGEWGIDESVNKLIADGTPPAIIVGIENSDLRMREYNPYDHIKYGSGLGESYIKYIIEVVKPYVDSAYRTLAGPGSTTIAGSSLGGLISYYAALTQPSVFGTAGIFSPSFWIAPGIDTLTRQKANSVKGRFFFYMGEKEGLDDLALMQSTVEQLALYSSNMIYEEIEKEGTHSESYWKVAFPKFYTWIMERKVETFSTD